MAVVYNPFNGTLTLVPSSGGSGPSPSVKYSTLFTSSSWSTSGSDYILSIPFSTHNITNPIIAIYEKSSSTEYDLVSSAITVDTSFNITLKITSSPFDGLIILS